MLLTERTVGDRAIMAGELSEAVSSQGVDQILQDLDADTEILESDDPIARGPFIAYQLPRTREATALELDKSLIPSESPESSEQVISQTAATIQSSEALWEEALRENGLELSSDQTLVRAQSISNDGMVFPLLPNLSDFSSGPPWEIFEQFVVPSPMSFNLPMSHEPDGNIPANATYLLHHYKAQMDRLFSPLRVRKPPWAVLHLPAAMSAVGDLTVWGRTSHAKASLFYAVLAVSAFNLDRIEYGIPGNSNYWWYIGECNRERARREMKQCLASEIQGPGKSKYKEILMGILSMVTISVRLFLHGPSLRY
jgi:arginine metabolism regulation protein II